MAGTVVFVGDVNVDLILGGLAREPMPDREIRAESFEVTIGSSAAIAAVAYASLGGTAAFRGIAGDDDYGQYMKTELSAAGIDTRGIRLDPSLRTGVTVNLVTGTSRTQITYPGAIPRLRVDAETLLRENQPVHVHFTGFYQQEDLLPLLANVCRSLRRQGCTVSLDPQWDESGKWACAEEWLAETDLLFCNRDEALGLSGKGSLEEALENLSGRCSQVIVKNGEAGAAYAAAGERYSVPGYRVELRDSIGAGDNFAAGFLFARLEKGFRPGEALAFANAAAARSCCYPGGTGARSSETEIIEFMRERK